MHGLFQGRTHLIDTFAAWLQEQTRREDLVGEFARLAVKDKAFPAGKPLHVVLLRYEAMPAHRELAKRAHREWRRFRLRCLQCSGVGITDNHATGEVECSACAGTGRQR